MLALTTIHNPANWRVDDFFAVVAGTVGISRQFWDV
jgi:hypothetical protein